MLCSSKNGKGSCTQCILVHLHKVCELSIMAYSVCADHCVGKKKLKSQQVVQLSWKGIKNDELSKSYA